MKKKNERFIARTHLWFSNFRHCPFLSFFNTRQGYKARITILVQCVFFSSSFSNVSSVSFIIWNIFPLGQDRLSKVRWSVYTKRTTPCICSTHSILSFFFLLRRCYRVRFSIRTFYGMQEEILNRNRSLVFLLWNYGCARYWVSFGLGCKILD